MTLTVMVLLASLAVFSWKILGYLLPERVLSHPRISSTAGLMTVGLLTGLLAVQSLSDKSTIVLDERLPALAVAAVLLKFKAPYLVVVVAAAITAAVLRAFAV